jgi:flagellar protein FliO/FliZ
MASTVPTSALLWFAAIVALIPLALWLLKRTQLVGSSGAAGMRSISSLPLSNTHRLLTVEVGQGEQRRWLVLGVTPHSINLLHTLEPAADAPAPDLASSASAGSFAQMLGRVRGNTSGADRAP